MPVFKGILTAILIFLYLSMTRCSKGITSDGPSAELILGTPAGVSCYLIRDESGKAVGGNCLPQ